MKTSILLLSIILFSITSCKEHENTMNFKEDSPYDSAINARDRYNVDEVSHEKSQEALENIYLNNLNDVKNREVRTTQNQSTRIGTNEPTWVDKNGNRYTADEIRKMRANDPNHIYKTSGTPVYSEKEIIEKRMEEYEEDNK